MSSLGPLSRALRRLLLRIGRARAAYQRNVDAALVDSLAELGRRQHEAASGLADVAAQIADLRVWLERTSRRGDELAGLAESLTEHAHNVRAELARIRRLVPGDAPLYGPGGLPLETFDAGLGGQVVGFRADPGAQGPEAGVYVGFENYFRGSEDEIRQRQAAYLPLLEGRAPVLDIGCGRGELLELLRDAGIDARGVDLDADMVSLCRQKGFEVDQGDAVAYLRSVPEGSLGAIFAAQVIEHLSYDDLIALLRLSLAGLRPAGRLIVETVNPHAPQALKNFWLDPTHRNPLFPETVLALCRLTGFASAFVWYPQGTGDPDRDRGEQSDYAVVAETAS